MYGVNGCLKNAGRRAGIKKTGASPNRKTRRTKSVFLSHFSFSLFVLLTFFSIIVIIMNNNNHHHNPLRRPRYLARVPPIPQGQPIIPVATLSEFSYSLDDFDSYGCLN